MAHVLYEVTDTLPRNKTHRSIDSFICPTTPPHNILLSHNKTTRKENKCLQSQASQPVSVIAAILLCTPTITAKLRKQLSTNETFNKGSQPQSH
jgi:hypothetical protein